MCSQTICASDTHLVYLHIKYQNISSLLVLETRSIKHKNDYIKYVEVQNINSESIANFKNAIGKSDLFSQLDLNHNADPNAKYNILSSSLENAKNKHIPKKLERSNRRKHFI